MKKAALLIVAIMILSGQLWAAGTVSESEWVQLSLDSRMWYKDFDITGDSSNGTVPSTQSTQDMTGLLVGAQTNPGTTGPTDDYDITLTDDQGEDVFGTALNNRDTANTEYTEPYYNSQYGWRPVKGKLTLAVSNTSNNSATVKLRVFMIR